MRGKYLLTFGLTAAIARLFLGADVDADEAQAHAVAFAMPCSTTAWEQVANTGPSPRYAHALASDTRRTTVVLFGGYDATGYRADTWEWDGTIWNPRVVPGFPPPRAFHAMAYDESRDRVVLFGGQTFAGGLLGDTWEWDAVTGFWTLVSSSGPSPRFYHSMAYDTLRHRVVLYGGNDGTTVKDDTWSWDGASWTQIGSAGPGPRQAGAMAYDEDRGRVVLFGGNAGGGSLGDVWEFDGLNWTQEATTGTTPRSDLAMSWGADCHRVVTYGGGNGIALPDSATRPWNGVKWTSNGTNLGRRFNHAMAWDRARGRVLLFGGYQLNTTVMLGDTWELCCKCNDEAAPTDSAGNVLFPDSLDVTESITYTDVDSVTGNVEDLYAGLDTSDDTWYPDFPCEASIGGVVPDSARNAHLDDSLSIALGAAVTAQAMSDSMNSWDQHIWQQALGDTNHLATAGAASGSYTPPVSRYCPPPELHYVLGGRDLVFVHGLRMDPLFDKIFGTKPEAKVKWKTPSTFPGSADNPEFYGTGYWKAGAERYWADHIQKYLRDRGICNRYVIVAYPSTERLEVGAQAILTQIGDAMRYGTGVVDLTGRNYRDKFGTPSFVIISHSTGGLATDVALRAAVAHPNLNAAYIPQYCKAHIALHSVFSGSRWATAAVVLAGYLTVNPPPIPPWLCPLVNLGIQAINETGQSNQQLNCSPNLLVPVLTSILVDLCPIVTQLRWASYIAAAPVRTVTVVGGHPTYLSPFKWVIQGGFDDGVTTLNSQIANPNTLLLWPSGYQPRAVTPLAPKVFDMGMFSDPFGQKERAIGYYLDQVVEPRLNPLTLAAFPPFLVAGGGVTYLSPTGMIQPVWHEYALTNGYSPLRRQPNHFSYLQSSADHFGGSTGLSHNCFPDGWNGSDYRPTYQAACIGGEPNSEETRAITNWPALSTPYAMPYVLDDAPLTTAGDVPKLKEILKGKKVNFTIKVFGKQYSKSWWVWKRTYHRLWNWEYASELDYVYGSLLRGNPFGDCSANLDVAGGKLAFGAESRPNPFAERTTVEFDLPAAGEVRLGVVDVSGRRVRMLVNHALPAGRHDAEWDGRSDSGARAAPGVYFWRLSVNGREISRKVLLLK